MKRFSTLKSLSVGLLILPLLAAWASAATITFTQDGTFYANKGSGFIRVNTLYTNSLSIVGDATFTNVPVPASANDFFFRWSGDKITTGAGGNSLGNPLFIALTSNEAASITYLFSKAPFPGAGYGDLDGDLLADPWEVYWELDPLSVTAPNGGGSNPDADLIPSIAVLYTNAWPLSGARLLNGGYGTGSPFNNSLEFSGLDGTWMTNFSGQPRGDDPRTDPTVADTDDDGMPDGWEYYFWRWRGAGSTNSLTGGGTNVSGNAFDPVVGGDPSGDVDGDGLSNLGEYNAGTDPTHADTDRDGIPDQWELDNGLNPLEPLDAPQNPDEDVMAREVVRIFTNFHAQVYLSSAPSLEAGDTAFDPRTAWGLPGVDHPNTVFYSNYDEYLGPDRLVSLVLNDDGIVIAQNVDDSTDPNSADTDGDSVPDGWEAYVGLNPNDQYDVATDHDDDELSSLREWANTSSSGSSSNSLAWANKLWPTDPGVIARIFSWQNAWYDVNGDGRYDAGDVQLWNGDYTKPLNPTVWHTLTNTIGRANPLYPPKILGNPYMPILYSAAGGGGAGSAWADDGDGVYVSPPLSTDIPSTFLPPVDGDVGAATDVLYYHNDPHPKDTDFDGLRDSGEEGPNGNPTSADTDSDHLPDGWESYAGTIITTNDATEDPDQDGLVNNLEYWTGTVYEWMHIDTSWPDFPGVIVTRFTMRWDLGGDGVEGALRSVPSPLMYILPPDFASCPSFDVSAGQRASSALGSGEYHTTLANNTDSDLDQMDDYWEVFHALNPTKGGRDLMLPAIARVLGSGSPADVWDADPATIGVFEIGIMTMLGPVPFTSIADLIANWPMVPIHVGPFNFGLEQMDQDADGLNNWEEYSYESLGRTVYHTDPTSYSRTDPYGSFATRNYVYDNSYFLPWGWISPLPFPFEFEVTDGHDTDNDGLSDLHEQMKINDPDIPFTTVGNSDPVNGLDPVRNRAVRFNRSSEDFLRSLGAWQVVAPVDYLTRFTVEAWVRPSGAQATVKEVVVERGAPYSSMWGSATRVNFRIGLSTNRVPYAQYNGAGLLQSYVASAPANRTLPTNVWTHLAAVYDGTKLYLYVNGALVQATPSTVLPANGLSTAFFYPGSTILGASCLDVTAGLGVFDLASLPIPVPVTATNFFDGWLDEVRVWNGARAASALPGTMRTKLNRTTVEGSATLVNYFTFDETPDLDINWPGGISETKVPNTLEAMQGPNLEMHQTIPIWSITPQRSLLYDGSLSQPYNYILFAEDLVSHAASLPPEDDYVHFGGGTNTVAPESYKNSTAPYVEDNNFDLLYLNSAFADGDVFTDGPSWLTGEVMTNPDAQDNDGDGMSDAWETANALDAFDATGDNGADADPDGDGLSNYSEFLIGSDPWNQDSDGDGILDSDEDADGDGLGNVYEQDTSLTLINDPDTDDDGFSDGEELDPSVLKVDRILTSPLHSRSPVVQRSLVVNGTPVRVPDGLGDADRFMGLASWTVEAWVKLNTATETGAIIKRTNENARESFELGVYNNQPYVRFETPDGQEVVAGPPGTFAMPANEWIHLAGVFDSANDSLRLYVNGIGYQAQMTLLEPTLDKGWTTMGEGINGNLDEVRVWKSARSSELIENWVSTHLLDLSRASELPPVDLTFVIDTSGSMGSFIDAISSNITEFVNSLAAKGYDVNLAGVRYSDTLMGGGGTNDRAPSASGFYSNATFFLAGFLNPLTLDYGGDGPEDGLGGLTLAATENAFSPSFRDGASKVFVLVTDNTVKNTEDPTDTGAVQSLASVISSLVASNITVLAIDRNAADVREIVEATGGERFDIDTDDYSVLLQSLAAAIGRVVLYQGLAAYYPFDDGENVSVVNAVDAAIHSYGAEDFSKPLNWNFALRGVTFDSLQAAPVDGIMDLNANYMADWWEGIFFDLDPDPAADPDGDGLSTAFEYLADTNPKDSDTDNDGILDSQEDPDLDGLVNIDEFTRGTDPRLADTDDDGELDGSEVLAVTDPANSLSPLTNRVLRFDGSTNSYAEAPVQSRFALTNFTIEAAVKPAVGWSAAGTVVSRLFPAYGTENYNLGLDASRRPVLSFESFTGPVVLTSPRAIPADEWSWLTASYNASTRMLSLLVNGIAMQNASNVAPAVISDLGPVHTRIGAGFNGDLDEVKIWGITNPAYTTNTLTGSEAGLVAYYRMDDGTSMAISPTNRGQVQDFKAGYTRDWTNRWLNGATLFGNAQFASGPGSAADTDGDGMPDWWELANGLDPYVNDAAGDLDGDGLSNLNEYLTDNNPRLGDSDGDAVLDGNEDFDGDGLSNRFEQDSSMTLVNKVDTDDDGVSDGVEVNGTAGRVTNPLQSLDPIKFQSLSLDGDASVAVESQTRHRLNSWTVQAFVWPSNNADGVIMTRRLTNLIDGYVTANYELGVRNDAGVLRPYVLFSGVSATNVSQVYTVRVDGTASQEIYGGQQVAAQIAPEQWTHVAGTYDSATHTLGLYINGVLSSYRTDAYLPPGWDNDRPADFSSSLTVGGGPLVAGVVESGFEGYLDEVQLMGGASTAVALLETATGVSPLASIYRATAGVPAYNSVKTMSIAEATNLPHKAGELLVRFKTTVSASQAASALSGLGVQTVRSFQAVPVHLVRISDGKTMGDKLDEVRQNADVLYAEPNYLMELDRTPNDPNFPQMYGLNNSGQAGGTTDADIDAPEAWDRITGNNDVIVAVIDSGVQTDHPDLAANMWVNPGEIAANGIDDDGNGLVDDVHGWDFANGTNDLTDTAGHGTHVAGTIAAVGNNGVGTVGVCWQAKIMALKIGDYYVSVDAAISALDYAVQKGARISNNSWGGYGYSQSLYDAIAAAGSQGHLVVAAAGNYGMDNDVYPSYPASYDLDNIISVGASDRNDAIAYFSNYGALSVDLLAPGVSILSTYTGNSYGTLDGTSMASPHVAGAAALVLAGNPALSYSALRRMILSGSDDVAAAQNLTATGGRLNVGNSAGGVGTPVLYFNFDDGGVTVEDFSWSQDWLEDWVHAGAFVNGAAFATNETVVSDADSDEDGIPDWWENMVGMDPYSETGDDGAAGDPDGDGLSNLYEYYLFLNPYVADTDRDGTTDFNEDDDGDGLSNGQEQTVSHTRPDLTDTDDDGVADNVEITNSSDPLSALTPEVSRAVSLSGTTRLKIRAEEAADVATNWTVEAWVMPAATNTSGIILRRAERYPVGGIRWTHYELGLSNGVPYILYTFRQGGTNPVTQRVNGLAALSSTNWTHVAAVQDTLNSQLRLYINGKRVAYKDPAELPPPVPVGVFETLIGGGDLVGATNVLQGFSGQVDAVRVWRYNRTGLELQEARGVLLPEFTGTTPDANRSPERLFNFDDGGLYLENSRYTNDWEFSWKHAAQIEGNTNGASLVVAAFPPANLDSDDDALSDVDERSSNWKDLRSESPYIQKYLTFDGTGRVVADEQVDGVDLEPYASTNWTLESWVRVRSAPTNYVPLITRRSKSGDFVNYEIGLVNTAGAVRAYARYQRADSGHTFYTLIGSGTLPVGSGTGDWRHIAATFSNRFFALYVNGQEMIRSTDTLSVPYVLNPGYIQLGATGLVADLKDVRIWNDPRSVNEIEEGHHKPLLFSSAQIENVYDGTSANAAFLGRNTTNDEDGLSYDHYFLASFGGLPYYAGRLTHKFTMESWIKMQPSALGGTIAERKVDVLLLPNEPDWRVVNALRVDNEGRPLVEWWGQIEVITPVYDASNNLERLDVNVEEVERSLTSEMDVRDGTWHHVAAVGDGLTIKLYIDGRLDTESISYYVFRARPAPDFESFFSTYAPEGSVLRVADDGIQAQLDEVMFWNEDRSATEIAQHMNYGLSQPDIRQGVKPIEPLPQDAIDDGLVHRDLISYLPMDGEVEPPFVVDFANNDIPYIMLPTPGGAEILSDTRPPVDVDRLRTFKNQLLAYFAADDGGEHVEQLMERNDYGYAGQLLGGVAFATMGAGNTSPFIADVDGDTLPDWWETLHGFDAGDPDGMNGAWGDADSDGLNNRAEYLAGTDPRNFDTDGNGVGDYDSLDVSGATFGELYSDGDQMDDAWEALYPEALSPLLHDGTLDPDVDGWDNFSEFMARTDPSTDTSYPQPELAFKVKYNGDNNLGPLLFRSYSSASMDGIPDARGSLGPSEATAGEIYTVETADMESHTGTLPSIPVVPGSVEICIPAASVIDAISCQIHFVDDGNGGLRTDNTIPTLFGSIDYDTGTWQVRTFPTILPIGTRFNAEWSIRLPIQHYPFEGSLSSLDSGHFKQGNNWLFAFIDNNGNADFDRGEPAGIAVAQPLKISWAGPIAVEVGLTDDLIGYERFSWVANTNSINDSTVRISRITSGDVVVTQALTRRTYFHENDYLNQGMYGIPNGGSLLPSFRATITGSATTNSFSDNWTLALATPATVSPYGGEVVYARSELVWTQDVNATASILEIRRGTNGAPIYLGAFIPPFREADGKYRARLPLIGGDAPFTNGVYYWRVQSVNPSMFSAWSAWTPFNLNLQPAAVGAYSIYGNLSYYGRVTNGNFVIQAFPSLGFGGLPDAQVSLGTNRSTFALHGLRAGTYVVRGFLDLNGNKQLDTYESFGYIKATAPMQGSDGVRLLTVPGNEEYQHLLIRDQDADNDNIPDAWEIRWFNSLTTSGYAGSYSDYDRDGLDDLQEYLHGTDPTNIDSDGDGVSDYWEVIQGFNPLSTDSDGDGLRDGTETTYGSSPLSADSDGDGIRDGVEVAKGSSPVKVDTDDDGFNDALEILQGFNPANSSSKPSSVYLFEIVGQSLAQSRDVVVFNFNLPDVTNIVTSVVARLAYRTNLLSGELVSLPATDQTIYKTNWSLGPWSSTNVPPSDSLRFYSIQWQVP